MFCINCGKEIPNESMFCPFCGHNIKATEMIEKEENSIMSEDRVREEKINKAFQMYLTNEEINGKNVQLVSNLDLSDEDIRDYFDREFGIRSFEYDEKLLLSYSQNMMKHTGFWLTNYKIFWKYDNSLHSHGCWNLEDIDSVSLSKELGDNWIRLLTRDKKMSDFILTNYIGDAERFKCRLEMFFYDINRKNVNIKRDFEKYLEIACNSVGKNHPNLYLSRFYDDRAVEFIKKVRECLFIPENEKIYLALNVEAEKGMPLTVTDSGIYYIEYTKEGMVIEEIPWEELKTAKIEVPKYYSDVVCINERSILTHLCKAKVLVKILSQIQDILRWKWEDVVYPYINDPDRKLAWLSQRADLWKKYEQKVEQQKNEELIKKNEEALQAKTEAERELQEIREREERKVQREKEREERRKQKAEAKKAAIQKAEEEKLRKEEEKRIIAEIGEEAYKKRREKEELIEKAQKRLEKIEEEERQYAQERAERLKRGEMGEPLIQPQKTEQEDSTNWSLAAYKLKEKVVGKEKLEEEWRRKKEKEEKKAQQEKERRAEEKRLKQKNEGKEKEELRKKAQERLEKIEAEEREYERQQAENLRRRKEGLPEINYEQQREQKAQNAKKGKYSFTLGILSAIGCFIMPIVADILAVLGIIFGVKGIKTSNKRKAQIGIVLCVLVLIWSVVNIALG